MISSLVFKWAEKTPDASLLVTSDRQFSYAEVAQAALRFASRLKDEGFSRGDHIGIAAQNGASYVIAGLAINLLGGVIVAINNQLVGDALVYVVQQSGTKIILADKEWIAERSRHLKLAQIDLPLVEIGDTPEFFGSLRSLTESAIARRNEDDLAVIIYTSGTTGPPKGVMNPDGSYLAVGEASARLLELTSRDRIFTFLPLFHSNPLMLSISPALTAGASVAIGQRFSASTFFEEARRFQATGFTCIGTILAILAARYKDPVKDHQLRFAFGGGTPKLLWEEIETRFGFHICECYGMTEVGGWVSSNSPSESRRGSCGRLRTDMDVRIFDGNDVELPVGQEGEIVVRPRKPNLMLTGYYQRPDLMVRASRNFWFHTGDRGHFDKDGYLYFHGRTDELIRRGGEMISPAELETHLREMPGVVDCAAVGVADEVMGQEIKVVLVCDMAIPGAAIREYLAPKVPKYMLPRYVEQIDKLPRTETEKILWRHLQYVDDRVQDLEPRTKSARRT